MVIDKLGKRAEEQNSFASFLSIKVCLLVLRIEKMRSIQENEI